MASLALMSGPAGAAVRTAAPAAPAPIPQLVKKTRPMVVTGINETVAKAHGFQVRTDAQGRKSVVKVGSAGTVTTYNVVSGNCGNSYMWYYLIGSRRTEASTGFNVTAAAISYSWDIAVVDNAGTSAHHFGGGLAFRSSWSGTYDSWHSVGGYSWAEVVSGYALLWDGEICSTLYPWDWENIP